MQAGNFTCREHGVESFKESFLLDFSISENESNTLSQWSSSLVELFNVFLKLVVTI